MTARTFLRLACLVFAFFSGAAALPAQAPADEKARIEGLISHIEGLQSASFIRNGKEYSSTNAAKFLRAKWSRDEDEVKTAEDFIAKVASVSGTSGKPYVIRFNDGKEVPCGEYLTGRLKK